MSSTQTLLEKLEETRRRIDELYHSSREEANTDDDDKARKLFGPTDAWKSWFPEHAADFGLPHAYRDMSRLREQRFVEEHLYGASADVFRQLSSLDALLLKFLILRRLDSESAATRFLAFRTLVIEHDLVWSFSHTDVQAGLQSNAFHFVPVIEPQEHRPVVALFPRRIDYKTLEIQQVKRAWFFGMMTAVTWTPTAQTAGMVLLNSLKDVSMAQMNSEFRNFLSQAINRAMPARFARSFLANEPFIFGTVLWPLFKYAISEKIRSRMSVVGTNYELILAALPPRCVPEEMGGERANGDEELARLMRLYKFTPLPGQTFVPAA
eukprot:CAMPEP_0174853196 /NCGR_PEP_ID=MMETSP1114-20130205/27445_1 /TAXON_ID=312471 /ORGANISM="Neobodo designis, Strain CCAP 1951/1" /LENGTH=322 /DNA_ID=CAMNT_0016087817 /DNA_START=43 /DNA_END=1011 /DNA_ORIENTATION=+